MSLHTMRRRLPFDDNLFGNSKIYWVDQEIAAIIYGWGELRNIRHMRGLCLSKNSENFLCH